MSDAERRRALTAAIDNYEGVARKPVVRTAGVYHQLQSIGGYGRPARSPAYPQSTTEKVKHTSRFASLFAQNRAWCTGSIPYVGADGVSVNKFQKGFDGHRYIRLDYENTRPVSARIACPSVEAGATSPRRALDAMTHQGLLLALRSFNYAAAEDGERGLMQRFIAEADAVEVEQPAGKPLRVNVRKKADELHTNTLHFMLEPVVHCVGKLYEMNGAEGGSRISIEIDYDWRDGSWLPIRTTRTATSTPAGDETRVKLNSRFEVEFRKLEFLDSAADEDFLPKIPKGLPVTDDCNPQPPAELEVAEEQSSWRWAVIVIGLLITGSFSGWWYVQRQR